MNIQSAIVYRMETFESKTHSHTIYKITSLIHPARRLYLLPHRLRQFKSVAIEISREVKKVACHYWWQNNKHRQP